MPSREIHVCDADCLINLQRHFGGASIPALRTLGKKGGLKLPEGVVHEVMRHTGQLGKFVNEQRRHLQVAVGQLPALHTEIPRLERLYGEKIRVGKQEYSGFWQSAAGRKAADAQVIATAKLLAGTSVSDDRAVKLACALEGVPCIGWSEFARRLGLIKPEQLSLNLNESMGGGV